VRRRLWRGSVLEPEQTHRSVWAQRSEQRVTEGSRHPSVDYLRSDNRAILLYRRSHDMLLLSSAEATLERPMAARVSKTGPLRSRRGDGSWASTVELSADASGTFLFVFGAALLRKT
jgi:hypothetical protein